MKVLRYWKEDSFDVTGTIWTLSNRKSKRYSTSGSDNSNKNIYTYNELGFRGNALPLKGKKLMAVGCSHTEGIGVNDNETWPYYLADNLGYSHVNLGYTGRSNDYISRAVLSYTDLLKPDLVCIMYTYPSRREYYTEEGTIEPFHSKPWGWFDDQKNDKHFKAKILLSNKYEDFINWYKNHLLIIYFLQQKKISYIWNGIFLDNNYDDGLRFDGDYFIELNRHATASENKTYADSLYNEIKKRNL